MDDSLEAPSSQPKKLPLSDIPQDDVEAEGEGSDEEEGGLDWTKLLPPSQRPVIPRRGEKEFEPRAAGGGTNLQVHVLDRARNAMFETLRATRSISSKAVSYAIWYPTLGRAHVTLARGIHFASMGHSAPRETVSSEDGCTSTKIQKRLELLPEEAIYLIERGSVFCWKEVPSLRLEGTPGLGEVRGSPMSVQQAFSEMMGREGLTLEKFQVYAYLKRLGYVVTRADPPDPYYPIPPPYVANTTGSRTLMERLSALFKPWISAFSRMLFGGFNWWRPIRFSRWLYHDKNYGSLFRSLRFIPAGHQVPLKLQRTEKEKRTTAYRIFYNLYKPSTPFKKSAPAPPDFQVVVVNARTTPMPTLQELTDLFDLFPEMPLSPPRQKRSPIGLEKKPVVAAATAAAASSAQTRPTPFLQKVFPWLFPTTKPPTTPTHKPNPFQALKTGKKTIVIAAVDCGNISFFRFGQGEFTEWPMA